MIHIGIDTSNYKTSLASVDDNGTVLANISEYLDVDRGERGLRQSDAFFKHSNKLPVMLDELFDSIDKASIASIGVSSKPRRVEGSYMPCFRAGLNLAKVLSDILEVPIYEFSHQEGHIASILESGDSFIDDEVILMHLSGGTSEFLKCRADKSGYETSIVGGSLDISFGQLLDRFGVALGFPFPAGMYIDMLAGDCSIYEPTGIVPGIGIHDAYFNLSGPETRLMDFARKYNDERLKNENISFDIMEYDGVVKNLCFELMSRISEILIKSADTLSKEYEISEIYMAGGVASSSTIRKMIKEMSDASAYSISFGDPNLSSDNAVGTAYLSRRMHYSR